MARINNHSNRVIYSIKEFNKEYYNIGLPFQINKATAAVGTETYDNISITGR